MHVHVCEREQHNIIIFSFSNDAFNLKVRAATCVNFVHAPTLQSKRYQMKQSQPRAARKLNQNKVKLIHINI